MNQAAERTFVKTETRRAIKAPQTGAAGGTDAFLIEREGVRERRPAERTEVRGFERPWSGQTGLTDGNTGPLCERSVTKPTIIGIEERKKAVGDPAKY